MQEKRGKKRKARLSQLAIALVGWFVGCCAVSERAYKQQMLPTSFKEAKLLQSLVAQHSLLYMYVCTSMYVCMRTYVGTVAEERGDGCRYIQTDRQIDARMDGRTSGLDDAISACGDGTKGRKSERATIVQDDQIVVRSSLTELSESSKVVTLKKKERNDEMKETKAHHKYHTMLYYSPAGYIFIYNIFINLLLHFQYTQNYFFSRIL